MQIERVREYEGNFLSRPETLPLKWNYQKVTTRVHGTVTFTAGVALPMSLSFATTAVRYFPELRANLVSSWSPHFMYGFFPSWSDGEFTTVAEGLWQLARRSEQLQVWVVAISLNPTPSWLVLQSTTA
jgi:hypothetical protein